MARVRALLGTIGLLGLVASGCGGVDFEQTCATDEDCLEGYRCAEVETGSAEKICFRACTSDSDCLDSQSCEVADGQTEGVCRFDQPS